MKNTHIILPVLLAISLSSPAQTLLISKGSGGDGQAATQLHKQLAPAATLSNLALPGPSRQDLEGADCTILLGQGAADALLQPGQVPAAWLSQPIAIYTHLLDRTVKGFLKRNVHRLPRLNLYITDAQYALLKENDAELFQLLQDAHARVSVFRAPLALNTIERTSTVPLPAPVIDYAIWLGGNYMTSDDRLRQFSTEELLSSLSKLRPAIRLRQSIGIFVMPRVFADTMTSEEKLARLNAIRQVFPDNPVTLYASLAMQQQLPAARMVEAPPYAALMQANWGSTQHFASVDQYNLFSDLAGQNITPFLLDEQDQDQLTYAASYVQSRQQPTRTDMMTLIRQHQCAPSPPVVPS